MIEDDEDDYNSMCTNFHIQVLTCSDYEVTEDLIDNPRDEDWKRIALSWTGAPETSKTLTVCWACFSDVGDDLLEAEV